MTLGSARTVTGGAASAQATCQGAVPGQGHPSRLAPSFLPGPIDQGGAVTSLKDFSGTQGIPHLEHAKETL